MRFYNNPTWQLKFNWICMILWLISMIAVPFLAAFRHSPAALFIMEVSLYANVIGHFSAIPACEAAIYSEKTNTTETMR